MTSPSAWGRQPAAAPVVFGDSSLAFPQLGAETPDQQVAEEEDADANEEDDAELQAALQVGPTTAWQSKLRTCFATRGF